MDNISTTIAALLGSSLTAAIVTAILNGIFKARNDERLAKYQATLNQELTDHKSKLDAGANQQLESMKSLIAEAFESYKSSVQFYADIRQGQYNAVVLVAEIVERIRSSAGDIRAASSWAGRSPEVLGLLVTQDKVNADIHRVTDAVTELQNG